MKTDHAKFVFMYETSAFKPLSDEKHKGLTDLLTMIEADEAITDLQWAAYMLATTYHECAGTWQPIAEYGKGKGRPYGKPAGPYANVYYGRGFVQLTWMDNYAAMSAVCKSDLVKNPDLAMQPDIAYKIMSHGMRHGSFTGARLAKYIHDGAADYVNARRIINGLDCAEQIAGHALKFENMLRECTIKDETKGESV